MFQQITIIGPGLLGASLAMAIKESALAKRIVIWARNAQTLKKCQSQKWCDAVFQSLENSVVGSDLVLLCTPVHTIPPLLEQIQPVLTEGALVSDVGSTKSSICRKAHIIFKDSPVNFIGSHPMAGSERAGMENARADLFKSAACILTPLPDTPKTMIQTLKTFWESLEMKVTQVSPKNHDVIVAHVSHLPHVMASVLCSYLAEKDNTWQALSGGGLRDTTRIAAGDTELWKQILEQNRDEVLQAIHGFQQQLDLLKTALAENNSNGITSQLERGRLYRKQLTDKEH